MLVDDRCSIYEHRPSACRVFDCRIYPAAGTRAPDGIRHQSRRWLFDASGQRGQSLLKGLQRAARFLSENPGCFSTAAPNSGTQLALEAIKVCGLFDDEETRVEAEVDEFIQRVSQKLKE